MEKNSYDFLEALGQRESSGNYKAKNSAGYIGKYQMGEMTMEFMSANICVNFKIMMCLTLLIILMTL